VSCCSEMDLVMDIGVGNSAVAVPVAFNDVSLLP